MNNLQRIADENYLNGKPIMSDDVYDATFGDSSTHHELTGHNAKLPMWMGSLDKKRDEKSLKLWLNKTKTDTFVISAKLDGISALYDPLDNKLFTRGDGQTGCNISKFIKHLDLSIAKAGAKKVLAKSEKSKIYITKAYVRGELVMANDVFQLKYNDDFKNPRNLVAGQFSKKIINTSIIADIHFVPYEIIISSVPQQLTPSDQIRTSPMLPWIEIEKSDVNVDELTKLFDDWSNDCVFAMDGLVVTENRMYSRCIKDNPGYAIAFKKETNVVTAVSTVRSITWATSRWGLLKPVINIEPVHLSGVVISKCSGHNAKYILDNKIGPGAQIVCVRSGDVIPYILSITQPSKNVTLPSSKWKGVDLYAEENIDDDKIEIKTLTNLFSQLYVKHISLKTIEKMYIECKLDTFPKMLNCTKDDLYPIFKDKSADRIVKEMANLKRKQVDVSLIVGASGVLGYGLGESRVMKLFARLPSLRSGDLESVPTVKDVCRVGFSEKSAENIVRYFPMMIRFIEVCVENGIRVSGIDGDNDEFPAIKRKICLSGFRNKKLERKYDVLSTVTEKCELLVCKSFAKETSKMTKAKGLDIDMVLLSDFEQL